MRRMSEVQSAAQEMRTRKVYAHEHKPLRMNNCMAEGRESFVRKPEASSHSRACSFAVRIGAVALTTLIATPAIAADPLACTDTRVLQRIRDNLQNTGQNAQPPRKLVNLKEPREVLLGAPPRSANTHATTTTFIAMSRYCEGRAEFDAGAPELVYWRLDQLKDGSNESSLIDLCHKLFDQFEDGCKAFRPGG